MKRRVFDAHFHVGEWGIRFYGDRRIQPIVAEHRDYSDCMRYIEKHEITYGIVVPTYLDEQEVNFANNDLVLKAIENIPNLFGGYWVSPLPECTDMTCKTINDLPHSKIKALKMSAGTWGRYTLDPQSWDRAFTDNMKYIIQKSREYELVIQLHTGSGNSDPYKLEAFMKKFGDKARYHFIHMGESTAEILKFVPRFIEWIRSGYDVYTDQIMAPTFGLVWMVRELQGVTGGSERLVFGTDSPWSSFESEYWKVEALEITDTLKEKILLENACKLYRVF